MHLDADLRVFEASLTENLRFRCVLACPRSI